MSLTTTPGRTLICPAGRLSASRSWHLRQRMVLLLMRVSLSEADPPHAHLVRPQRRLGMPLSSGMLASSVQRRCAPIRPGASGSGHTKPRGRAPLAGWGSRHPAPTPAALWLFRRRGRRRGFWVHSPIRCLSKGVEDLPEQRVWNVVKGCGATLRRRGNVIYRSVVVAKHDVPGDDVRSYKRRQVVDRCSTTELRELLKLGTSE